MKNNILKNRYLIYTLLIITGMFLGWLFFHPRHHESSNEPQISNADSTTEHEHGTIWTCAMHPQIRMDHPGNCPICGMELIPLDQNSAPSTDADAVRMTKEAAALANVLTTVVSKQKPVKEVRLYGKVQADERLYQTQVVHVPGRIEKLSVNFTGETIKRGQVLAEIYSPELITAQQELLETAKTKQLQPELYEASRERLRQWKLTDEQINEIEASGKTMDNFKVLSNTSGTVTARRVNTGDHVSVGTVLYEVADLSKVWILFDAYESDLPFLNTGKKITFTLQAIPGTEFNGTIAFIDPVIDPVTRVAKVRVEASNQSGRLKPEMFATGIVSSNLTEFNNDLVIPRSAILWTGKRSIVYVKQPGTDEPVFKLREVTLGPALGESYVVTEGLQEGEEIVTSGTFSVDASAQLEGKPSMMNIQGGTAPAGHQHGNMQEMQMSQGNDENQASGKRENTDFKKQLNNVYQKYLDLKNALVNSDEPKAKESSEEFRKALSEVDMKLLSGDAHMKWMDMSKKLAEEAGKISSGSLVNQRAAFASLSDQMYTAVKTFGLSEKTVYYQFCPMYNNNKGAFWLSEIKDIKNPYYGEQMLTCGETKETIK
jgi:Cu(I)/Ag(I) efflux system membrane fusion protein